MYKLFFLKGNVKCDFFPHLLFSSTSFISSNTRKVTHSCVSIVSCLGKHLGREINSFYAHDTNSLSLSEGVGDLCRTIRMADSLKITCFFTTSTLLPSKELWKTSCERSLENWNPFGPFLSIHKQRNDKLKEVLLHGAARSCMTS